MNQEAEILNFFDIQVEHFPDRSTRWLFQDKDYVQGLLEILANELVELIDFSKLVQINRSFIPDTLREQESDIVFSVPFRSESATDEMLIYILIEHQSTVDITMGFRVLFYMTQIWDFQRREWESNKVPQSDRRFRPILPIVYYTGVQKWKSPLTLDAIMDIPDILARFVPRFDTLFLSVKETDVANLTKTNHPLGWLLTVLQKEHADKEVISRVLLEAILHINTLDEEQSQQRQKAIIYLLQLILHRRSAAEHDELITILNQSTPDMEVETMAESIIERSNRQVKTQAKQEAVLKLLQIRFHEISQDVSNRITAIHDISSLDSLFEKVATVQTLDEIDWQNYND